MHTALPLAVPNDASGAEVKMVSHSASEYQQWEISIHGSLVQFRNVGSDLCLGLGRRVSTRGDHTVIQEPCVTGSEGQLFSTINDD